MDRDIVHERTGLSLSAPSSVKSFLAAGEFFQQPAWADQAVDPTTAPSATIDLASTHSRQSPPREHRTGLSASLLHCFFFAFFFFHSYKMSSLWNALTGQKSNKESSSRQSNAPSTPEPTTTYAPPSFDPSTAQGVGAFLNSSTFADPSQLGPLAGLNQDALEYITLDDSALSELPGGQSVLPSRGWTDDLCYGTGITYLSGLTIGGAWGLQEGLRRSDGQAPKLRLNSTLNAITRRGPFLGNSAGVVAIVYNCFNSYFGYLRGKHDAANSIAAGVSSGFLFKSTRGLRPMLISGGIVGAIAGVWTVSSS